MLHIAFSCPTINQQPINIQLATFHHWKSSTRNHAKKKVFLDLRWWSLHMWHYRDTFWMILPQSDTICDISYIVEILYLSICVAWLSHDWSLFRSAAVLYVNIYNQSEVNDFTKSIKFKIISFTKYHVMISYDPSHDHLQSRDSEISRYSRVTWMISTRIYSNRRVSL